MFILVIFIWQSVYMWFGIITNQSITLERVPEQIESAYINVISEFLRLENLRMCISGHKELGRYTDNLQHPRSARRPLKLIITNIDRTDNNFNINNV